MTSPKPTDDYDKIKGESKNIEGERFQILFKYSSALSFTFQSFAQDTKEVIILQTSDVHSRIEPINQKATNIITKVVSLSVGQPFSNKL